ncbi:MAG: guanylate kinase [Acidimicrobiales bacterium]
MIAGPGGVGKGTLVRELIARDPALWLSRSWTTRARRPGEAEDAYHFVSRQEFERRIAEGGFFEWAEFHGNLMGTPTPEVGDDRDLVLEIDVQGAAQALEQDPSTVVLFVVAPSPDEQAARLRGRGDDEDHVRRRLEASADERAAAEALGATIVVNDDLESTVAEVEALIADARASRRP